MDLLFLLLMKYAVKQRDILISYLARNVSLGLRLAANITAGHMLLSILSGFVYNIMNSGIIFFVLGLLPLVFIIAFSGLEFAIAFHTSTSVCSVI